MCRVNVEINILNYVAGTRNIWGRLVMIALHGIGSLKTSMDRVLGVHHEYKETCIVSTPMGTELVTIDRKKYNFVI